MEAPHSRLLTQAAKNHLGPLGMKQKGRSRIWRDDRGWFVIVVEFQPSGFSKGSYLNVGAHFLWTWSGFSSFDLGYRVEGFVSYESDSQFAPEAGRLAIRAASEVLSLRERLPAPWAVASALSVPPRGRGWPCYHRAVSLGLSGQAKVATREFLLIAEPGEDSRAWVNELRNKCRWLADLVVDEAVFRAAIEGLIAQQRAAIKLPPASDPLSGQ